MKSWVLEKLCCPQCKSELEWNIKEKNKDRIILAECRCSNCGEYFSIENEIGNFVLPDDKGFLENDCFGSQRICLKKMEKDVLEKLISTNYHSMNVSDLSYLADLYREQNKHRSVIKLKMLERKKKYNDSYNFAIESQFDFMVSHMKGEKQPIIDLASGRGSLLKYLLKKLNNEFIATDISTTALIDLKSELRASNVYDRVSLIACNIKKTPFRDKQFTTASSFFALGHVKNVKLFLNEIMRISSELHTIENIYPEDGSINYQYLIDNLMNDHFEDKLISIVMKEKCNIKIDNVHNVVVESTPKGDIIPMAINDFPIVSSKVKNCFISIWDELCEVR